MSLCPAGMGLERLDRGLSHSIIIFPLYFGVEYPRVVCVCRVAELSVLYHRRRPSHADAWATGRPQPRSNPSDVGQQPKRGKGTRPGASRGRRGARLGAILVQARA